MVFSSVIFLFRFMPVAFALYFIAPKRMKNGLLFFLSLFFYAWGELKYVPLMLFSTVLDYTVGLCIETHRGNKKLCKLFLFISLAGNLGMLMFFKYSNFFIENINWLTGASVPLLDISLPLGISFYTFQTLAYSIDVYWGKVEAERNFLDYGAFVTLFPQLVAGPIVKYTDISRELKSREFNLSQIQSGAFVFIMGLGSKVLLANNIGSLWTQVQELGFDNISTPLAWMGIIAYSLQIYFDFSGYSLMAIGLGRMLGFDFPQNFNYPYMSRSVTEFWRRWHMTLSGWFREYVYIPLGGNRCSQQRQYFNIFVVWALTGFWHGASRNFVFWGLYFFVFLCLEKMFLLERLKKGVVWPRIYLLFLIVVSWAIFGVTDFSQLGVFLGRMFIPHGGDDWLYYLRGYAVTFILGFLLSTPVLRRIQSKLGPARNAVSIIFAGMVLLVSVAYLVDSTYNPFLYFRF